MHETKKAEELLKSKLEFEDYAARFGVNIKSIRADNGIYTAKVIQDSCKQKQQHLSFCAVGAYWQNGIAERFIGSIVQRSRTILLHAMAKWPSIITEDMWPFAIRHMVCCHNATVRRGKTDTPYQLFTGQDSPWSLPDFRVFGCPVYVLHKRLQDGDNLNKWKSRSWQGVYIGPSSCHANNVPLIYNPATTHISPQFHVVYDEGFTSITSIPSHMEDNLMRKLFEKAYWTYDHANNNSADTYDFHTFWSQTSTPTILHIGSKKRTIDTISILDNTTTVGTVSEPSENSHNIPSTSAVSASAGTIQTSLFPAAVSASVAIPQTKAV
jgi:hypothetical protein